jgi:hypothetical protein
MLGSRPQQDADPFYAVVLCARAAFGDTTAAPPRSVMNSHRFISLLELATGVA